MQVTIRDVAKASGVSPSTVSRALAPGGAVSPVTRERVRAAADRLESPSDPGFLPLVGSVAPHFDGGVTGAAEGGQPPQRVLPTHLVVRGSTAALDRR
ncbi:LacI family DNA-binding transcriptional regulator [Streptomyces sp. NPDC000941]